MLRDTDGHQAVLQTLLPFFRHTDTFSHAIKSNPGLSGVLGQSHHGDCP